MELLTVPIFITSEFMKNQKNPFQKFAVLQK